MTIPDDAAYLPDGPRSEPFMRFVEELVALCDRHGVLLEGGEFGVIGVWPRQDGEGPLNGHFEDWLAQ